ncbi:MAG TPA: hypothetical protein VGK69_07830 [Gaiellaceae bacterium]
MISVTRSAELEEFGREGRRRFEAGDDAWFEQTTAHGEVGSFGTAAEEQSRGREAVLALTSEQIREMNEAAGLDIGDAAAADEDVIEAYQAGDSGWIVTHSRFTFEDGSSVASRVINLVVRDPGDGAWKWVLTTSQVLVPNELLQPGSPLLSRPGA